MHTSNNLKEALFSNVTARNFSDQLRKRLQRVSSLSLFNHEKHNCANDFVFCVFFYDCSLAYEISHTQVECTGRKLENEFIVFQSFAPKEKVNLT